MLEGRPILEGVICHEPVSLEIVAALRLDDPDDIEYAEKALGIDKMPVDARTGLQATLKSFKN